MPPAAVPSTRGTAPLSRLAVATALAIALGAAQLLALDLGAARGAATIPDEPDAFRIDGPSFASLVADVDGDGVADLVRVTTTGGDGTGLGVEVWRKADDEKWDITAPATPLLRGASPEEEIVGGVADKDGLVPARVGDGVRLLLWHEAGRAHALAVVNGLNSATCCLAVFEVTQPPRGGPPVLRLLINTHRSGDMVFALDMNGDGTDELAIHVPGADNVLPSFSVLTWSAGRFTLVNQPLNVGDQPQPYLLGNSDGLPGDEIGFIGSFGPNGQGFGLTRVSLRKGVITAETTELPGSGVVVAEPSGRLFFGGADQPTLNVSWPADKDTTVVARSTVNGTPVGILGSGANQRVLVLRGTSAALVLIPPDLVESSVQAISPSDAARPFLKRTFMAYTGAWPDPPEGFAQADVYDGTLLLAGADAPIQSRPIAALPSMAPLGQLGRNGEWTALAQRMTPTPRPADIARDGGELLAGGDVSVTLARTSDVLTPEEGRGSIQPAVEDAVVDARAGTPGAQALLIGKPTFQATVNAPLGSISMAVAGGSDSFHLHPLVREPAPNTADLGGPPFHIPIVSSLGTPGNQAFDAVLHVITVAGHGYTATWHVRLLRTPPKITAEAPFLSLGFGTTIQGRTDPSATVTADGQSVHAGPDGRYQMTVPASLIPREVRVQARDPIGNVATATVSVIAPLDYRRLPWLPIVALLTAAAGAVLFLRAPSLARQRKPSTGAAGAAGADDATFEEIDGD
jgi:hypothetical protein